MRDVVLYSKPGCMFCAQVSDLLTSAGIPFRTVDVPERRAQDALIDRFGARAFPLVLVDRDYIGGFTHVVRLHAQGRLRTILSDADSEPPELARPRAASSTDLRFEITRPGVARPAPGAADTPPGETAAATRADTPPAARSPLADYAKLGEYLQRMKKE